MPQDRCSPAYVNRVIPELEGIIARLRSLEEEIQQKRSRLREARVTARRRGEPVGEATFLQEEAEIEFLRILANGQIDRIQKLGGEIKGGYLIDFPSRINGEDVLLCWKPGEKRVAWYHGIYDGMMSRRPIPPDALSEEETLPGAESDPA